MQAVTPQEFFQEEKCGNNLTIDISKVQSEDSRKLMPYSLHLPVLADPKGWNRKFRRILADYKNQPFTSILVFSGTGRGYDLADKISAGTGVNIFYLEGGITAYKRYLEDLTLSWLPRNRRIKTEKPCKTCNEENILTEVHK